MRRKGVFLIFSLWLFVFLAVLCLSLGFRTYLFSRKSKLFVAQARVSILADSAVNIAKYLLEKDDGSIDHAGEEWAKPLSLDIQYRSPAQMGFVKVTITDASDRRDINKLDPESLDSAFLLAGVREHEALVARIADYVDEDPSSRTLGSEDGAKNAPIVAMEELFSITGMDLDSYDKITALFDAGTNSTRININTASRESIENIVTDEELKRRIINKRFAKDNPGIFSEQDFSLLLGCVSGENRARAEKSLNIRTDYFHITVIAGAGGVSKKISCLYKRRWGIIYSYEE